MAFSESQYKNFIKVIVVAAVAKEFRKSAIMQKIYNNIKKYNLIATGELLAFRASKAIIPTKDDRFLVDSGGVIVKTVKIGPKKTPIATEISIKIRYGLTEGKYFNLTTGSGNKKWFPNIDNIAEWVKIKKARGNSFTITKNGVQRQATKEWEIKSVAFLVARKIAKQGIDKKDFTEPFENKTYGVEASLIRASNKIQNRISELYGEALVDIQNDVISNIL